MFRINMHNYRESMKRFPYILVILLFLGCKNNDPKVEEPPKTSILTLTVMGYTDSFNKEFKPYEGLLVYFLDQDMIKSNSDQEATRSFDILTGTLTVVSGKTYPYSQVGVIDKFGKCSMSIPYGYYRVFLTNGLKPDSIGKAFFSPITVWAKSPNTDQRVELSIL